MSKLPAVGADPYTYPGHSGIDFLRGPSWLGKPFYASGPGVIRRLSRNLAGGNWVVVKYDGIPREVGYCHMDSHAGCPAPGSRVAEGTRLGYVGRTGSRVTGPHVHVEILGVGTDTAVWQYFDRNRVVGAAPAPAAPAPAPARKGTLQGLPWTGIQRMLKSDFGYTGRIDNIPGKGSISAFQRFMNAKGYGHLAVDGIDGVATLKAAQSWLKLRWGYTGAIDGIRGSGTTGAWGRAEAANGRAYARVR
ncbi:peptidoglycan DD-metalloendopeptidase family protein [Microbacterium sp.]|uniref:peptidoglycan DD-metalloendopeptidase family protein n=1 Tax=Microbacterium sp. TaxID=51671 RepID=UPI003A9211E3